MQHLVPHNKWVHKRVDSTWPAKLVLFFVGSLSHSSFYTLFSPPKSTLHFNSHSSSLLLYSYKPLVTLRLLPPNSVIVPQNHITFLCSYLFALLEIHFSPSFCWSSLLYQSTGVQKNRLLYFFAPFICPARRWLFVTDV